MRATHHSLQAAVLAVHTLDEQVWERFLNADALRMRNFLKASLRLREEEKILRHEHHVLQRQWSQHRRSIQDVTRMVRERDAMDRWEWKLARWRELQRQHYKPWAMLECQDEIDTALKEISAFEWSTGKQTTGRSFLGWRECRRVDPARNVFQFQFHKTFRGYDVMDYVNTMWDAYTDAKTCQKIALGPRIIGALEILQQFGPNTVIVRALDRIPAIAADVHLVLLVFRKRTEHGFVQFVRTICCPELMKATESEWPNDLWPTNFLWFQWDLLQDEKGYDCRASGSMGYSGLNYANMWMWEALNCALRSEQHATGKLLITQD